MHWKRADSGGSYSFHKKKAEASCFIILLAVPGGKGGKKNSTYDWPWRDGFLFHPHDYFLVIKGECSLSEGKGGEKERLQLSLWDGGE